MIDIAWSEFLFIAVIALVFIGPKELPVVLKNIGRWIGKARAFAKDLSAQLDLHSPMDDAQNDLESGKRVVQNNEVPDENKNSSFENTNS